MFVPRRDERRNPKMLTVKLFRKISALVVALFISLGWLAYPASDSPVIPSDKENLQLSFVAVSDVHVMDTGVSEFNFENIFRDIENYEGKIDAAVFAGDLTELGLKGEYDRFFNVIERQTAVENIILATGNHDVRYAYKKNKALIMSKAEEYLGIDTNGESFYKYELNGCKFVVLGTEKQIMERAYISDRQLEFLDSELKASAESGQVAFVVCHQPLANTHGLPEVWKTGDLGKQSQMVRDILTKYKNVVFINGHLHDGMYERSVETLSENVYSVNLPTFGKSNDFGVKDKGIGYYVEVYGDKVSFHGRNFIKGSDVGVDFDLALAA